MKKIAVITTTRAEFGLLLPVIKALRTCESDELKIELVVSGTHFSDAYGHTVDEIKNNDLRIDHRIEIPVGSRSAIDISRNQSETLVKFTELFLRENYRGIVILGDRYEILAVAIAAGNTRTPIFHLCGGDTTEGALDEWIRHAITKMSYLHFVTNKESYHRVIQLGESPNRVFNYGSTSIDNILKRATMPKQEALESLGLTECPYAICTYHPVTMEMESPDEQIEAFLQAIQAFPDITFIVTKSNSDEGGARINELLDEAKKKIENLHVYPSLGVVRYLSLMRNALFVLGNSSSGIIEAPAFHIPTVNIGDRQKGRLQSESIINCETDAESIIDAVNQAMSEAFQAKCAGVFGLYGDGNAAVQIAEKIISVVKGKQIDLKKKFYDI